MPFSVVVSSLELALTIPPDSPATSSIAILVASDALSMLPTGEWRRSLATRLAAIEELRAWVESEPTPEARERIAAETLDLLSEILAQ